MTTRTRHPVALADQADAATAHAHRVLLTAADNGQAAIDTDPPGRWLAERAAAIRAAILDHTIRACPHIADTPQLLCAAAWAPRLLVCLACLPALGPDPAEDGTCDRCQQHAPLLTGSIAAFGPILFAYATCHDCTTSPR